MKQCYVTYSQVLSFSLQFSYVHEQTSYKTLSHLIHILATRGQRHLASLTKFSQLRADLTRILKVTYV